QEQSTLNQEIQSLNTNTSSFFASFYNDDDDIGNNKNILLIKKETALYDNLSQISKYHIIDEEYKKVNPLT
ncbi:11538_t:CDS:1, partial [Cetraspora pellucida]